MGWRKNLRLVAEDLGKRKLSDVLKNDKSWDLSAQTVIIAEGLVMYLSPEAVRDLFCQCAAFVGGGSRIAFSYIPAGADGRPDAGRWTGLMLYLQKVAGESWEWSIRPEELGQFLEETGWTIAHEEWPVNTVWNSMQWLQNELTPRSARQIKALREITAVRLKFLNTG